MSLGQEFGRRNVVRMAGLDLAGAQLIARMARTLLPIGAPDSDRILTRFAGIADLEVISPASTKRDEGRQSNFRGPIETPSSGVGR